MRCEIIKRRLRLLSPRALGRGEYRAGKVRAKAEAGARRPVGGATRGIGAAIARALAAEAAHVVAVDRDLTILELAGQLPLVEGVPSSMGLVADVTDFAAVRGAAAEIAHRFGRCDHVVFAVGVGSGKFGFPFWKLEPADWEPVLAVNLIGAVHVAHA